MEAAHARFRIGSAIARLRGEMLRRFARENWQGPVMIRLCSLTATGAFLLLGTAMPAKAVVNFNALSINALSINALSINALSINALSINALSINALSINSLALNGLSANGSAISDLNGVTVEDVTLPTVR
jgi:hypothetical protein